MNRYFIEGRYRRKGAIGKFQPFKHFIYAESVKEATMQLRKRLYHEGFDNVNIRSITKARSK